MHRNLIRTLVILTLATVGWACSSSAQTTERRLEEFHCALRLPGADFTWLGQDELPGTTLACRDDKDRFVILIVTKAPPGYHIDARQGAAFEKGMARNPGIERLGSTLTNLLGMPCYEIRGRIGTARSLTATRLFAANGFLYNLQAMIPETPDGEAGKFDDLFAAFQFIVSAEISETLATSRAGLSNQAATLPTPNAPAPAPIDDVEHDVQASSPAIQPTFYPASGEGEPPVAAGAESSRMPWVSIMTAGGILGVGFVVVLLRMLRNERRVL
jgi:hypothetical protein